MLGISDGIIAILALAALILVGGAIVGLVERRHFSVRWLLVAVALVIVNDAMLTNLHGALPDVFTHAQWNWQGKFLALIATLGIAALPAFGWRRSGLTLHQAPGSLVRSIPVAILYCLFFVAIAFAFPSDK